MRYWQPKLRPAAQGTWLQFDGTRRIAIIRVVTAGHPQRLLLRADTWAADEAARDLLGFFPPDALRLCAEVIWGLYQDATARQGKEPTMHKQRPEVEWHPLLNADENTPGAWTLRDADGHAYGGVKIVRQGTEIYYLGQFRGDPIGRFDRLRPAVENVHLALVRATQGRVMPPPRSDRAR